DRAADVTKVRLAELAQRQKQMFADAEARVAADGDRLAAESETQRAAVARLRAELDKSLEDALTVAQGEVETHGAERRRALHELEADVRRRVDELGADADAERAVIEARLQELLRRVEAAGGALQRS